MNAVDRNTFAHNVYPLPMLSPLPQPSPLARHWQLDPDVCYLNHGSFGACPTVLLEAQRRYRDMLEREPVAFFVDRLQGLLDTVREELGRFVRCDPDDLALLPNATTGVNTVLRSLDLKPGDELVSNTFEYPACRYAMDAVAERAGARVVTAELPFPVDDPAQIVEAILSCVTDRTRLVLLSHITSQTGLILPVETIVAELAERGIDTLVDGAHGPGMVRLDLDALGAAYYTGNCHKWLCSPKGAAFLHVRRDRQNRVHPLIVSHGARSRITDRSAFRLEFDFLGTVDTSASLTIPDAIGFLDGIVPDGIDGVMQRNHDLVLAGRDVLCEALNVEPPAPASMIGSLATVPLPNRRPDETNPPGLTMLRATLDPLCNTLIRKYRIQVPVIPFPAYSEHRLIRISAQLYNSIEQIEYLADALRMELDLSPQDAKKNAEE